MKKISHEVTDPIVFVLYTFTVLKISVDFLVHLWGNTLAKAYI